VSEVCAYDCRPANPVAVALPCGRGTRQRVARDPCAGRTSLPFPPRAGAAAAKPPSLYAALAAAGSARGAVLLALAVRG
jgi:hypothetical protein